MNHPHPDSHEPVSGKSWLNMTWYKMPSGRYEIVAQCLSEGGVYEGE